jgi:hypothetical protein
MPWRCSPVAGDDQPRCRCCVARAGFFDYAHGLGRRALIAQFYACHHARRALATRPPRAVARSGVICGLLGQGAGGRGRRALRHIEGLLLLALVTAGLSGVAWFLLQGSDAALTWRMLHIVLARILIAAGVLHVLAVASHLLDRADYPRHRVSAPAHQPLTRKFPRLPANLPGLNVLPVSCIYKCIQTISNSSGTRARAQRISHRAALISCLPRRSFLA